MKTETTTRDILSQARKSIREQKKELTRLGASRQAAKVRCKTLNRTLKIQRLRLQETQESRDKWKQDCKNEKERAAILEQSNRDLESRLGLTTDELGKLRTRLAEKKKSAERSR